LEMYRGAREIATRQREVRKIGLRIAHQFRKDLQRAQLLRKLDATLVILFRRIKCSQLAEYPTPRVPHTGPPDFFPDRFRQRDPVGKHGESTVVESGAAERDAEVAGRLGERQELIGVFELG